MYNHLDCDSSISLCHTHIYIQVNVIWMVPPGPSRSAICDTIDTPAPPPEPIQTINIIEVENVSVVEVGFDAQQVTAAVMLVVKCMCFCVSNTFLIF